MIYPDLRISELTEQVQLAGDRFRVQRDRTLESAKATFHPLNILAHHKMSLISSVVGFLLFGKIAGKTAKFLLPKVRSSGVLNLIQAGWMWKAVQLSISAYQMFSAKRTPVRTR